MVTTMLNESSTWDGIDNFRVCVLLWFKISDLALDLRLVQFGALTHVINFDVALAWSKQKLLRICRVKLAVSDDFTELEDLFGCFIDQVEVSGTLYIVFTWLSCPLYVPHRYSGVIWWDNWFTVTALRKRVNMELMYVCKCLSQFDRTLVMAL